MSNPRFHGFTRPPSFRSAVFAGLLCALAAATAVSAAPDTITLSGAPTAGPTKGKLRVEWAEAASASPDSRQGVLRVFLDGSSTPAQEIPLEASLPSEQLALNFTDISGDGAQDLLFVNAWTGTAGAAYGADVFLWVPKLQRFAMSRTLSQMGEISPTKQKGCIALTTKCSSTGWTDETLCFNQATGRWRQKGTPRCVDAGP